VLQERRQRAGVLMGAASIALIALAVRPTGVTAWYITVPAVVTLVAAGYRLVLALRDAQGAADALRLSRTDELTGLPNRRAVLQDLDTAMRDGRPLALMLLDLDGFKDINDSLGHAAGDAVLGVAADRMGRFVGPGVSVARLGGDEFAVMVRDADPLALLEMAQRLRDDLLEPVRVEGLELAIRASIGITVKGEGDARATDLLRRSDVAMFEAKVSRAGTLLYDASRDGFSRQRLRLAEDLRRGIAEDQLVVWYQPQVDAVTHEVSGVEALVRWQHPTEGLLLPLHFLPDARRSGLMLALSEAVAHQVVGDARRWLDSGFSFRVSMNCAPPELLGGSLLPRLFDALENARLPAESLLVEVTEDSFLSDPERAREQLLDIRAHGVQVAIDDYGTGFSSLAYLRDLPVQELKMDRSFVSTILTDRRSRVIVDSTKQMAHAMGLRVVAEGVEDSQTAAELMGMGIDVLQGHHVSPPMAASEIGPWMRRWSAGLTRSRAGQGVGQRG
ncbi:MAG TPA: bifunctional diguanylate cyclase/phosphodiesterase, partial [Candidatus Limnocylindria bacterium]|nr:bifunctional diguanylate cyclase/phosphodiesterase [Candidatus Limnocylindria bacterium]